jgi:hypothetical protein
MSLATCGRAAVRAVHRMAGAGQIMSVSEIVELPERRRSLPQAAKVQAVVSVAQPVVQTVHYQPLLVVLGAVCAGIFIDRYVGFVLSLRF